MDLRYTRLAGVSNMKPGEYEYLWRDNKTGVEFWHQNKEEQPVDLRIEAYSRVCDALQAAADMAVENNFDPKYEDLMRDLYAICDSMCGVGDRVYAGFEGFNGIAKDGYYGAPAPKIPFD